MRLTWEQIKVKYPDRWVLMKDTISDQGELKSAEVICAKRRRGDISRFKREHEGTLPNHVAIRHTNED
jgi:hypothetical protein